MLQCMVIFRVLQAECDVTELHTRHRFCITLGVRLLISCAMDVPTHDSYGLRVYREILARDARAHGVWESRFGPAALDAPRPPNHLINFGTFERHVNTALPLERQLQQLRQSRAERKLGMPALPVQRTQPFARSLTPSAETLSARARHLPTPSGPYARRGWTIDRTAFGMNDMAYPNAPALSPRMRAQPWSRQNYMPDFRQPHAYMAQPRVG